MRIHTNRTHPQRTRPTVTFELEPKNEIKIPLVASRPPAASGVPGACAVCVCKARGSAYHSVSNRPVSCRPSGRGRSHTLAHLPRPAGAAMARNARASGRRTTRGRVCGVRCAVKAFPALERRGTLVPSELSKQPYSSKTHGYGYESFPGLPGAPLVAYTQVATPLQARTQGGG